MFGQDNDNPLMLVKGAKMTTMEEVQKKLDEATEVRRKTQSRVAQLQKELQVLTSSISERPKGSMTELVEEVKKLDGRHADSAVSLDMGIEMSRLIEALELKKRQLTAWEENDVQFKATQALLVESRAALKQQTEELAKIRTDLSEIKTADALGCTVADLDTVIVECPVEKIGRVIGRKGATLRHIEEQYKVAVQRIEETKISLVGLSAAVLEAKADIDRIIASQDEIVALPKETAEYLNSKGITLLKDLRDKYPNVSLELIRRSRNMQVRGLPEDIETVKREILALKLVRKVLSLPARVRSALIGKEGAMVDSIVGRNQTMIEVRTRDSEDPPKEIDVFVLGQEENVEAASQEIHGILDVNEEVSQTIPLDAALKSTLKANKGEGMKELFRKVNETCRDKVNGSANVILSDGGILVKAAAEALPIAVLTVEFEISRMESWTKVYEVDTFVIPAVVGKGGRGVRELSEGIAGARIEIDRGSETSTIRILGWRMSDIEKIGAELSKLLEQNIVRRIRLDGPRAVAHYLKSLRAALVNNLKNLVAFAVEETNFEILLRGSKNELEIASKAVEDYIAENAVQSRALANGDIDMLLRGGKSSKIVHLAKDFEVHLAVDKAEQALIAWGPMSRLERALAAADKILNGEEMPQISRTITLNDELFGLVMGKRGRTKHALESKFDTLSIASPRGGTVLTITGPAKEVDKCFLEIMSIVACGKVSRRIDLTEEQKNTLGNKSDACREISTVLGASIDIEDAALIVKGIQPNVDYAASLVRELIYGVFESEIKFHPSAFALAKQSFFGNAEFDKILEKYAMKASFIEGSSAVSLAGPKASMAAAKNEILKVFGFVIGDKFNSLEIGNAESSAFVNMNLVEISCRTDTVVFYDRDVAMLVVTGETPSAVEAAAQALRRKMNETEDIVETISMDSSQQASLVIGKGGSRVQEIEKRTRSRIRVDKKALSIIISASSRQDVTEARKEVEKLLNKVEQVSSTTIELLSKDIPAFIGRKGARLNEFCSTHDVDVKVDSANAQVVIRGNAESVEGAAIALEEWKESRRTRPPDDTRPEATQSSTITLGQNEDWLMRSIVGRGGARINGLRQSTACKIEVDSSALTITVSSEDPDRLKFAIQSLENAIETERSKCVFVEIPEDRMSAFIGFKGSHIREFELSHDVKVRAEKNGKTMVRIFGDAPAVAFARAALEEWIEPNDSDEPSSNE